MKKIYLILLFSANFLQLRAQQPWDMLDQWGRKQPIQKVHLHFDRETYTAGETAWFKAYLLSDYLPDTISSTLYVELLAKDATIINRKVLPVILGASSGQIELPDSLVTGSYTIRAYTQTMQQQSADYIFRKGIYVNGKKSQTTAAATTGKIILSFFPEGGNLVTGFSNNVAFKAVDAEGRPAAVKAQIRDSKGTILTEISDYHDGMGMFELNPRAGEKYYAQSGNEQYFLPDPVSKGITVNMIGQDKGFLFEVQQKTDDPDFTAAYLIGQMQHRVVFRQELKSGMASLQGIVNTTQLRSGIIQVTFFNRKGMPLAERLWFNQQHEYLQAADIITDTVDIRARARNRFRITLRDTVEGNISVSVVDAEFEPFLHRQENIITNYLLSSDLRGYVHNPYHYFSSDNDSVKTAIDLLMMTNGWRRFTWNSLAEQSRQELVNPSFITLRGKAFLRNSNRPFDDKAMLLMVNNTRGQKKRSNYMLQTGKDGSFLIDSLLFFDKNLLVFSDVRGKKSLYIDVKLQSDTLHRSFSWKNVETAPPMAPRTTTDKWKMDYEAILKENGIMLEAILLSVKNKSPQTQVEEKYATGMFGGEANRSIDLVNSDEALAYANIFDYLQFRVNGLQIVGDGADYSVVYRQLASASSMGTIPMTLFLDEVETDASVIAAIPANQVALVRIFSTFMGASGNAPGGVLAIYTKKSEDYGKSGSYNNVILYNGYSVVKEFYAPDYKLSNPKDKTDHRVTLDWRPNIFINSINPKIPVSFYNNDRTRTFKIIVEGVTSTGKLIWLEKLVNQP